MNDWSAFCAFNSHWHQFVSDVKLPEGDAMSWFFELLSAFYLVDDSETQAQKFRVVHSLRIGANFVQCRCSIVRLRFGVLLGFGKHCFVINNKFADGTQTCPEPSNPKIIPALGTYLFASVILSDA